MAHTGNAVDYEHRVFAVSPCHTICEDLLGNEPVGVIIYERRLDLPYSKLHLHGISYGWVDLFNLGDGEQLLWWLYLDLDL